jgi:hypothetical protein
VGEASQDFDAHGHDFVRCGPSKVRDEAETAGVVLERRIVEPARKWQRHGAHEYEVG